MFAPLIGLVNLCVCCLFVDLNRPNSDLLAVPLVQMPPFMLANCLQLAPLFAHTASMTLLILRSALQSVSLTSVASTSLPNVPGLLFLFAARAFTSAC